MRISKTHKCIKIKEHSLTIRHAIDVYRIDREKKPPRNVSYCDIPTLPIENHKKSPCSKPSVQKTSCRQLPSNLPLEIVKNTKN